jgi:acyl-CoA dehydrogenase
VLVKYGTEEQKRKWLLPLVEGTMQSGFSMTEPENAGSDPRSIQTTAVREGDDWVINGHKWFTTNASCADIILVVAETDPAGRPHRHASILVVPAGTPGMRIVRDIPTMAHPDPEFGRRGNHAEVVFTDCRVPADHLVGSRGGGFVLAQQRLGGGRIHHSMRWLGQAQRALDIMGERAVSRRSHGRLLGEHQLVQDYIALSHTEIQAARLLTFQTAWKMDRFGAGAVRAELGMIKAHVSKVVLAVLDRTIQVCGALGYSGDLPVEAWYRTTRFGSIGDGPDELHKSVLARHVLKSYRPVEGWPTEHLPSRRAAAERKWNELREKAGVA